MIALAATQFTVVGEAVSQAEPEPTPAGFEFEAGGGVGLGDEIVSERTEFSQTFATDLPGVYRTVQSLAPVNFQDGSGAWHEIDTTLAPGPSDELLTESTANPISIAETASATDLATMEVSGGISIGFGLSDAAAVPGEVDESTVTFSDTALDTHVEITALASGVKEAIILDSAAAPTHFEFPLQLEGVVPELEADGSIVYRDDADAIVARTPAGFMTDSSVAYGQGVRSDGVTYSLAEDAAGWTLSVDLDAAWLQADPARVFPVVVDPTTYTEPLASLSPDLDDTYVVSGASPSDRSGESVLKIGLSGGAVHRSFLHFSEIDEFAGMNIFQARLDLYQTSAASCTNFTPLEAFRAPQAWSGSTATSFPGPSADLIPLDRLAAANTTASYGGGSGCATPGTASIMVTPAAWNWTEDIWANEGLVLKAADEASTSGFRQFASADDPSNPPRLEVIWSDPTAGGTDSPARPTEQLPAGLIDTTEPLLSGVYEDPQAEDGFIQYFVYNPDNYYWGLVTGSVVDSGDPSTFDITSTSALPADAPLVVRAVAQEGQQPSTSGPPNPHSTMTPQVTIEAPSTVLTSPADEATISGTVSLTATAASSVAGLSLNSVSFYVDDALVSTDTSSPFTISGPSSNLSNGDHVIDARSSYGNGALVVPSAFVNVNVENSPCPADDGAEDDDTRSQATELQDTVAGVICANDVDWYSVELAANETVVATLGPGDPPGDLDLSLHSATSTLATSATTDASETIDHQVGSAGTYYLQVKGAGSTDEDTYTLSTHSVATESAEAGQTYPGEIGMNSQLIWQGPASNIETNFEVMQGAGITSVREGFEWRYVYENSATQQPVWNVYNDLMNAAAATGMEVVAIIGSPPYWASNCRGTCTRFGSDYHEFPPRNPVEYADFVEQVVRRYGENGTFWQGRTDDVPIRTIEILNEPWSSEYWGRSCPEPAAYATLVESAGRRVDELESRLGLQPIEVLISGDLLRSWPENLQTTCGTATVRWIKPVLVAHGGLEQFFDAYSVHPYTTPGNLRPRHSDATYGFRRIETIRARIREHQEFGTPRPLWITEMSWSTANPNSIPAEDANDVVTEAQQRDYVRDAIVYALRDLSYVEKFYMFVWNPDSPHSAQEDRQNFWGVRRANNFTSFKPVWTAICRKAGGQTAC